MTKFYQIMNFQHQSVQIFKNRSKAEARVSKLRSQFPDEGFYIIELSVIYSSGEINE